MATKTKKRTLAQRAGVYRTKLKRSGIENLEDFKGNEVPVEYVPVPDLLKHFLAEELINEAIELRNKLAEFKAKCQEVGDELHEKLMEEDEINPNSKGGFRCQSFNLDKYVDFKIDTVQVVNEEEITKAKHYKNLFLEEKYGDLDPVMVEMMNEVFENSKGKIDPRIGNRFNKYRSRVKNKNFDKFLDHFNMAFDINHTKRYERFMVRNEQGEYDSIVLTYSKLNPSKNDDETA